MLHHISKRQKMLVMIAVMSALFLVALDQTIISTALGKIVEEFDSFESLGFIVTAYLLFSTITVPIAGKLSDMFGRRPVLLSGVAIFTIGSLLSGISGTIEQLIAFRALQGLGGGIIMANAFTIIGDLFVPRERGKWQGLFGAVFGLSSVIGPLLGGFLTDSQNILGFTTNWRWTFFINVPIGIVVAGIIARYTPAIRHDKKPVIDYLGASFITLSLTSLILAVDNTELIFKGLIESGWALGTIKMALFSAAAVFGAIFVWAESKAKDPIIPLRFFKNRTFTSVVIAALLFGAAFLGGILYMTQFNQQVFGANATESGLMLVPMMIGLVFAAAVGGQIVSKTGRYKNQIVGGFILAGLGILALTTLTADSPYWVEAIIMVVIGLGLGTGMPILNLAVQNEFEQKDLGSATASTQLFRGLGSTIGTAVLSGILTAGMASNIGDLQNDTYIESLRQSPAATKMINDPVDTNTAMQLNGARTQISEQAIAGIDASPAPDATKDALKADFQKNQDAFKVKVVDAFTISLRTVFYISAALMGGALIAILFMRERPLQGHDGDDGPGVAASH